MIHQNVNTIQNKTYQRSIAAYQQIANNQASSHANCNKCDYYIALPIRAGVMANSSYME